MIDAPQILDALPDALLAADEGGRITHANTAAAALLRWPAAELAGVPLESVLPHLEAGRAQAVRKDGTRIDVDLSLRPGPPLTVALMRPLHESPPAPGSEAERYRLLFENAPVGILHFDANGVVTACNELMAQMMGTTREALLGLNILTLHGDPSRDRVAQVTAEALRGNTTRFDGRYLSTAGKSIEVVSLNAPLHDEQGVVQGGVTIATDVTDRRRIEATLARAERMASIGTLAAGVAHEINNPLVYVTLGLELIERETARLREAPARPSAEDWERLRTWCKDALEGAERVRTIVRDLRTFSRPADEQAVPVDVEKVLESSINMAMSHIRSRARLRRECQPLPPVLADESRLGQVFLNLLVNAAQAVPEGTPDQHAIVVRTRAGDGEVIVEIEDTGVGIETWKLERIFEPFWTDKPVGVGTGLGLSIVHGIVSSLGGEISVRSEPGKGSTFRVTLPARGGPPAERPAPAPPPAPGAQHLPRLLLIDDEPFLGITLRSGLRDSAEVVSVRNGSEAVELLLRDDAFDVILCDLMMPDITGMDVFERVIAQRPALRSRFVFMTGGAVTERARAFLEETAERRLDKPFRLEQVEALLGAGGR